MGLPNTMDPEWSVAPPSPTPPTERLTLIHPLTIHLLDVVDKTVSYLKFSPNFEPGKDEDLTRIHDYSGECIRGRIATRAGGTLRDLAVTLSVALAASALRATGADTG